MYHYGQTLTDFYQYAVSLVITTVRRTWLNAPYAQCSYGKPYPSVSTCQIELDDISLLVWMMS